MQILSFFIARLGGKTDHWSATFSLFDRKVSVARHFFTLPETSYLRCCTISGIALCYHLLDLVSRKKCRITQINIYLYYIFWRKVNSDFSPTKNSYLSMLSMATLSCSVKEKRPFAFQIQQDARIWHFCQFWQISLFYYRREEQFPLGRSNTITGCVR